MKQVFKIFAKVTYTLMNARLGNFKSQSFHSLHPMGRGSIQVVELYDYSAR
ncbi:hypothetical protein [Bdellovibrio sp. NC01]|uniref:hypothetical protein n=1 Tax=Bdellovibrio sp. NC01 TaxID=2220073 RepID=UPI00143DCBEB|nr:hypothetical protein [Bdellovibrio sp. NC01]